MKKYELSKSGEFYTLTDENGQKTEFSKLVEGKKVVAFLGQMGAGKTTLIKQICQSLGTADVVNSPTFAIVNVYEYDNGEIYHFDCYRLKNLEEALDFGAEEYINSGELCLIEWPEVISRLLPEDTRTISIEEKDGKRIVTIKD